MDKMNLFEDAFSLLARLMRQLEENRETFARNVSLPFRQEYDAGSKAALEQCDNLQKQMQQLQEEEMQRMLSSP